MPYLDCFRGSGSHILPVCSRERRASAEVTHPVGSLMTKSLGQAFSKACRSRTESWSLSAESEIFPPKQDQESSRNLSRGSRLEKARSMRVFSNNREDRSSGLLAQVGLRGGGTPLASFHSLPLSNCPVDSLRRRSAAIQQVVYFPTPDVFLYLICPVSCLTEGKAL